MSSQLIELAEQCEKATGPNLRLDALIAHEVHDSMAHDVELYTASIDAAVTLVPAGWIWNLRNERHASFPDSNSHADVMDQHWPDPMAGQGTVCDGHATTPALALCAAALRARAEAMK